MNLVDNGYTDIHSGLLSVSLCPPCHHGKNKMKTNHLVEE